MFPVKGHTVKTLGFAGHKSLSQLLNSNVVVKKQPQKQVTGHRLLTFILDYLIKHDSNIAKVHDLLSHHLKTSTLPSGDLLQNSIPLLEEAHH